MQQFFFLFVFQPLTLFRSLLAVSQWKDLKKIGQKKTHSLEATRDLN